MWLRTAKVAHAALDGECDDPAFYKAKLVTANFYMTRILPQAAGLVAAIRSGKSAMMALDEMAF